MILHSNPVLSMSPPSLSSASSDEGVSLPDIALFPLTQGNNPSEAFDSKFNASINQLKTIYQENNTMLKSELNQYKKLASKQNERIEKLELEVAELHTKLAESEVISNQHRNDLQTSLHKNNKIIKKYNQLKVWSIELDKLRKSIVEMVQNNHTKTLDLTDFDFSNMKSDIFQSPNINDQTLDIIDNAQGDNNSKFEFTKEFKLSHDESTTNILNLSKNNINDTSFNEQANTSVSELHKSQLTLSPVLSEKSKKLSPMARASTLPEIKPLKPPVDPKQANLLKRFSLRSSSSAAHYNDPSNKQDTAQSKFSSIRESYISSDNETKSSTKSANSSRSLIPTIAKRKGQILLQSKNISGLGIEAIQVYLAVQKNLNHQDYLKFSNIIDNFNDQLINLDEADKSLTQLLLPSHSELMERIRRLLLRCSE